MNAHQHSREPTLESELALATQALSQSDYKHALHHVVGAVGQAPLDPRWQGLLTDVLRKPGTLELLEKDAFWAGQASLAWWQHRNGQLDVSIARLASVVSGMPQVGVQDWLAQWVREAHVAKNFAACASAIPALVPLLQFGVGRISLLPGEIEAARRYLPLLDALYDVAVETSDGTLGRTLGSMYRRAGLAEKAVSAAALGSPGTHNHLNHIASGLALRALRRYGEAVRAFEEACKQDPDPSYHLEVMRTHADAGEWAKALEAVKEAQSLKADIASAESLAEISFLERALKDNLPAFTEPPLDSIRRRSLGHGWVFEPGDATANTLRQVISKVAAPSKIRGGKINVRVSSEEGPSNRMCLALMCKGTDHPAEASYEFSEPNPNRSQELSAGPLALWKEDGGIPIQAIDAAPESVNALVERLARTSSDFLDLWDLVGFAVTASAEQWLGAMLHPAMPLDQIGGGPDWVCRWQSIAAIGLARCESEWRESSGRRAAFISLMRGPDDWTKAVAIRAFTELALREPLTTDGVRAELIRLTSFPPAIGFFTSAEPLRQALRMLPLVPPSHIELAESLSSPSSDQAGAGTSAPQSEPVAAKKRWWEFWKS